MLEQVPSGMQPMLLWGDNSGMLPEQIMWGYVVASILEDYERALRGWNYKRKSHDRASIRREVRSEYFRHICGFLGISVSSIERKLDELDLKRGVA